MIRTGDWVVVEHPDMIQPDPFIGRVASTINDHMLIYRYDENGALIARRPISMPSRIVRRIAEPKFPLAPGYGKKLIRLT